MLVRTAPRSRVSPPAPSTEGTPVPFEISMVMPGRSRTTQASGSTTRATSSFPAPSDLPRTQTCAANVRVTRMLQGGHGCCPALGRVRLSGRAMRSDPSVAPVRNRRESDGYRHEYGRADNHYDGRHDHLLQGLGLRTADGLQSWVASQCRCLGRPAELLRLE